MVQQRLECQHGWSQVFEQQSEALRIYDRVDTNTLLKRLVCCWCNWRRIRTLKTLILRHPSGAMVTGIAPNDVNGLIFRSAHQICPVR